MGPSLCGAQERSQPATHGQDQDPWTQLEVPDRGQPPPHFLSCGEKETSQEGPRMYPVPLST